MNYARRGRPETRSFFGLGYAMIVRRGMREGQNYAPCHFRNPFYNALARAYSHTRVKRSHEREENKKWNLHTLPASAVLRGNASRFPRILQRLLRACSRRLFALILAVAIAAWILSTSRCIFEISLAFRPSMRYITTNIIDLIRIRVERVGNIVRACNITRIFQSGILLRQISAFCRSYFTRDECRKKVSGKSVPHHVDTSTNRIRSAKKG